MKQATYKRQCRGRNYHNERELLKKAINFICRCGVVIGFVCFIGIWGGMEFGPLLIGKRLLWSLIDIALTYAAIRIEYITQEGEQ